MPVRACIYPLLMMVIRCVIKQVLCAAAAAATAAAAAAAAGLTIHRGMHMKQCSTSQTPLSAMAVICLWCFCRADGLPIDCSGLLMEVQPSLAMCRNEVALGRADGPAKALVAVSSILAVLLSLKGDMPCSSYGPLESSLLCGTV